MHSAAIPVDCTQAKASRSMALPSVLSGQPPQMMCRGLHLLSFFELLSPSPPSFISKASKRLMPSSMWWFVASDSATHASLSSRMWPSTSPRRYPAPR